MKKIKQNWIGPKSFDFYFYAILPATANFLFSSGRLGTTLFGSPPNSEVKCYALSRSTTCEATRT